MDDLRFPVGKFALDASTTPDKRGRVDSPDRRGARALARGGQRAERRQFDTPYRPGGWTVRQVVHHVPDSHLNAYCRFKFALTEDNPTIKPYDEAAWANVADTARTPPEVSLTLLDALHKRWVVLLESMTAADFARPLQHPERRRDHARLDAAALRVARTSSCGARHFAACAGEILNAEC